MYCNGLYDEDDDDNYDSNCNNNSVQISTVLLCQYFLPSCLPKGLATQTLQRVDMPTTLLSCAVRLDLSHTIPATIN
jgi:hypothetical protein